jgi:hypothetical protein
MVLPIPPGTHWSEVKPPVFKSVETNLIDAPKPAEAKPRRVVKKEMVPVVRQSTLGSTLRFGSVKVAVEKPKKEPKIKVKLDPQMKEAARELRDRWLEQVNANPLLACGKYEVSRAIEGKQLGRTTFISISPALPEPIAA